MKNFITENFLLETETARELYFFVPGSVHNRNPFFS